MNGHGHNSRRARAQAVSWFLLGLGIALLAVPRPVAAQYFGKNKVQTRNLQWKTLTTTHFEIYHYEGAEELAVRASLIAEQAYREYANRFGHELSRRVPFILYASHNDFAQTNIADEFIGEGVGGFSEPFRNRMVLPYTGSHADFVHVIRHELVHVFMFDMAFGHSGNVGRSVFFNVPLWFAEGTAEWFSSGWDSEADMFMRDATINDYLIPLPLAGGFMVYKEGQAAIRLLSERYGDQKLVEFWRRIGRTRSVEHALELVYGLKVEDLDELFAKTLRKRYWPSYADLEEVADIARPLTDHEKERAFFNERPAISPGGDRVAFFSDRDGLTSLYLMSALDGKVLRRLAQGSRSSRFESFHSFRSSISFDPSGREIAFVAKSDNEETLLILDVDSRDITRSYRLGFDIAASPAWSPDGGAIVLVGTRHGRTDLYLLDLDGELDAALETAETVPGSWPGPARMVRLTDDIGDESSPAWSPDGRRLAFAFNARAEIDFEFEIDPDGARRLLWARPSDGGHEESRRVAHGGSIVVLELGTGRRSALFAEQTDRHDPVWIDDRTLCVVDNTAGISNLSLVTLNEEVDAVIDDRRLTNVLGGVFHPSYAKAADRLVFSAFHAAGFDLYAADRFAAEFSLREPQGQQPRAIELEPPPLVARQTPPDTLRDIDRIGRVESYRPRFSIDPSQAFGGGGVYFSSAVGLGVANVLSFSDLMGDHRLRVLLNFYGSFDNSDLAVSYFYLKRRVNFGVGVFHFHNYYNSVITSIGELLPDDTLFSERNYGLFGLASYPLSTFRRFDLELQVLTSERTNFVVDPSGFFLVEGDKRVARLLQPSLSFVHDSAFYGPFGPVTGSRIAISFAPTIPFSGDSLHRRTATVDLRKYWMPWRRNTFALRLIGAQSAGNDPRAFVIGGPFTLRGYNFYDYQTISNLSGTKLLMMNVEYRLPLLDYLIFGWPARWGLTNIGATFFLDAGAAWDDKLRAFGRDADGRRGFEDLRGDYGIGLRTRLGFLPLKLDWAWKTDLRRTQDAVFHFSIGSEF